MRRQSLSGALPLSPLDPIAMATADREDAASPESPTAALWEALAPALFAPQRLARARGDVDDILRLVPLAAGASILDLGCGAGAHAIELAHRGFRVTGVDFVASFVERARRTMQDTGAAVRFVHADMREFVEPACHDLVLCLYNAFGIHPEIDDQRVLSRILASLRDGGTLLIDIVSREVVAEQWRDFHAGEVGDTLFIERRSAEDDGRSLVSRWSITTPRQHRDFMVRQRLHDAAGLAAMIVRAGFAPPRMLGGLDGRSLDDDATNLVAIATA